MVYVAESWLTPSSVNGVVRAKAVEIGKKLTARLREKWPECDNKFLVNLAGDRSRVTFASKHQSLADFEQFAKTWPQDSAAKAIMAELRAAEKKLRSPLLVDPIRSYMADIQ